MEPEFVALELEGRKAEWLRELLADILLWGKPTPAVSLHCDNQASIVVAKNSVYNAKTRHIHLRHNIVRNLIKIGVISLDNVKSKRNLADHLTKGLCKRRIIETLRGMGLKPTM